ncbi:TIGR03943 family putative permease subunit [Cohnella nanjingensis]|uniref:TIGR03943 family protein n=1 Tax=Cohnella nanjingensis TaxID=1387779 RepID=A0A7X0RSG7_9BACL|nr:TIGR03943 family protein [Cohnella nanjingensis]MBB6672711.1 TIGR03943 family protein [Cohnella nanjingensis]
MIRFAILFGFAFMFLLLHRTGDIDKYINTKYAYLSISAIVLLGFLGLYQFIQVYREEKRTEKAKLAREATASEAGEIPGESSAKSSDASDNHDRHHRDHEHVHSHSRDHSHEHDQRHGHPHVHSQDHSHGHDHDAFGHSHGTSSKLGRLFTYAVLAFPILTGIFLPVATLDSSFVAAKGFSFPSMEERQKDPGNHQFLRPDTSVFYGAEGYDKVKNKELAEFADVKDIALTDANYLKGMEVVYNYAASFMDRNLSFDGFAYKGQQVSGEQYFVFRFGFIHCVADSGVFGMLVEFPKGTVLSNDDWVHVSGKLSSELYQPFKQTIPVLKVTSWNRIEPPKDPYVYRTF